MATLKEKIGYALGDAAAGGITWKVMSIAFPLFFTNVFGLTVADTATLMLIARMFDVVTDPLMGSLADRTQSRWGTYRPWLILGAVPFGLIFALLLYTPDFGPVGKRIWAYSLYLLMMAVYTAVTSVGFFFVPMNPAYIWLMVAVVVLTSIGIGIYSPLLWSMYADVSDYATEKNGTSSTGLIFSSGTMAMKFGTAISGSLVALLLGFAGFISGTDATGQTVITITDADAVNRMIWLLFSIFPAVIAGLMLALLYVYPIKK